MNKSAIPLYDYNFSTSYIFEKKIQDLLDEYDEWKTNSHNFTLEQLKKYSKYWLEKSNELEDIKFVHDSTDSNYWTWAACYNWIMCKITKDIQNYYLGQLERFVFSNSREEIISVIK